MADKMNYYILLDLFDPKDDLVGNSDNDPRVIAHIKNQLEAKQLAWSNQLKNPMLEKKARNNMDLAKKTLDELLTMDIRRKQYAEAKSIIETKVRKGLSGLQLRGYILPAEIERVAKTLKLPVTLVEQYVTVEIREPGTNGKEPVAPKGVEKYNNQLTAMEPHGIKDLYDLLTSGKQLERSARISAARWKDMAKEDLAKLPQHNNQEVSDKKSLYQFCIHEAFASDAQKDAYDDYLAWRRVMDVLEEAGEATAIVKQLEPKQVADYIDALHEACGNEEDAAAYLKWYCEKHGIALGQAAPSKAKSLCPLCDRLVDEDIKVCPHCGALQTVKCPECGEHNPLKNKHCQNCAYDFTNLLQASALCELATQEINLLNFDVADMMLNEAEHLWKECPDIQPVRQEKDRKEEQLGPLVAEMREAAKAKLLHKAQLLYDSVCKQVPGFKDPKLEEQIALGIQKAKLAMDKAAGMSAQAQCPMAIEAYNACADYPGVRELLERYPPLPPTEVTVESDNETRCNFISWKGSGEQGVTYTIVRKKGTAPVDVLDGEALATVGGNSYADETPLCGVPMYYAVAARKGPVNSKIALSGQAVENLFDVQDAQIREGDTSIQGYWNGMPPGARVEVWRKTENPPKAPGDGTQIKNVVGDRFLDQGLDNDTIYYYLIVLCYKVNGTDKYSKGLVMQGTPSTPPAPVDYLMARLLKPGHFELEWDQPPDEVVEFYYSETPPDFAKEDYVELHKLRAAALPIHILIQKPGKGTFSLPGDGIYYLVSATIRNNSALIGATTTISSREIVRIDKVTVSGADLCVLFDWPEKVRRVLLAYRTDRYSDSPEDSVATKTLVNRAVYDLHKAIILKGCGNGTYYMSLYAEIGSADGTTFSAGSNYLFCFGQAEQVTYEIRSKWWLRKLKEASIVLDSSGAVPALQVYSQNGGVPVFRNQGTLICEIPALPEAKNHMVSLPVAGLHANTYLKVFCANDADYDRFDLVIKTGTSSKLG